MSCSHANHTIDMVCNDCGYDLIVDAMEERFRKAERERIIKLLETHAHDIPTMGACYDMEKPDFIKLPREDIEELIADIKGENK